jgi:lipoprotein-anchoring transpeptidase ErfK/SrfK
VSSDRNVVRCTGSCVLTEGYTAATLRQRDPFTASILNVACSMTNQRHGARRTALASIAIILGSACIVKESDSSKKAATDTAAQQPARAAVADTDISVPAYDSASLDTAGLGSQTDSLAEVSGDSGFKHITRKTADVPLTRFPARIPSSGPLPLQLEVFLDRASFSPGIIDGNWGKNAMKALMWFRIANGMDSSGTASIEKTTYDMLVAAAQSTSATTTYQITAEDVKGPFATIPNLVYSQAKLKCLCYSSPAEAISERFHVSRNLLAQLNPKASLDNLAAGASLVVPNVRDPTAASPTDTVIVARLIVSKQGFWTHAIDATGRIVYHFPSTLGAGYDPSPTGDFKVTDVSRDPAFHYQPKLFAEVPDTKPEAHLPPGPNSPVGVVWIALSKPHYGIHGTASPETIGYANSHGCVRLTNWDALKLAEVVEPGTPVQFQ